MAGSDGNIYSYKIKNGVDYNKTPKILKQGFDGKKNYLHVVLRFNQKSYTKSVHKIICESFHGLNYGYTVSHENGIKTDNRPENLKWRTLKDNHNLKILHGKDDCGIKNSRALFNEKQLEKIRYLLSKGITQRKIAKMFKTNERNIGKIKRGERYARS